MLEAEVFFLMELQGGDYDSIMSLPWSRRKRFIEKKQEVEKKRANSGNSGAGRRSYRRRR